MKLLTLIILIFSSFLFAQKKCGFVNGLQEGNCIFYYDSGRVKWNQNWKQGKLDGKYTAYHENGKLKAQGVYKKDQKVGEWTYYDEKGEKTGIEKHSKWKGNTFIDICEVTYYKNGKITEIQNGKLVNGLEEGKWEFFDENKKLTTVCNFINGKRDGESLIYKDGSFERTEIYKNGKLISTKNK